MATKKRKKTASKAKHPAKRESTSKAASHAKTTKSKGEHRQRNAVLLFAAAVLLLFVALVPAPEAAFWNALHKGLFGLFGVGSYIIPVLVGYTAVAAAMDKSNRTIAKHTALGGLLLLLLSTLIQVSTIDTAVDYGAAIQTAYFRGETLFGIGGFNAGAFGALLGDPLERFMGDVGAKIILALALFVYAMLVTGATLRTLFKPFRKTAEFTKTTVEKTRQKFRDDLSDEEDTLPEERKEPEKNSAIDIDMGDGYLEKPLKKRDPRSAFEEAAEEIKEESERPQLRIDDIIGRAMDAKEKTNAEAEAEDEPVVESMTKEEVRQEEQAVAQQIEEQGAVKESYTYPSLSLLKPPTAADDRTAREEMQYNAELLVQTLKEFGISSKVVDISRGPSVTRYELQPNAGVKISRITGLADDIALRLATTGVRIEAPIPNKAAIGIEVPNKARGGVCLRELLDSDEFSQQSSRLTVALGRDISGQIVTADLATMPHLLIAGTTGSGKSVCTNSMIQSVLFHSSPEEVRMILIDPKQVEFSIYNGIPHLLVPVVTNPRKAAGALGWAVTEMINRYHTFTENNVRDIKSYNKVAKESDTLQVMPQILIVIDELSDLMMAAGKEVEDAIVRLAQMARAAGMHLVIATQRPSVDVITGLIKANIPSRLALTVASAVDSRTILDTGGAEKLLGRGDMLFHPVGLAKPIRVQGCFVSDDEVAAVVEFLKTSSAAQYDEHVVEEINRQAEAAEKSETKEDGAAATGDGDEMLPQAIEAVVEAGQASTSLLQRRLRVGYARAGRLIDEMEQRGIIGPHEGSKPRQVLISRQQWLEMQTNRPDVPTEE
ncbi:MAG: DNA translocase FtsK 4TM domain-containing protein [Clostridia bacterium]|nr:DNA translocase FtsK 4TM domain-containing protein [Clostridia bacterium]